MRDITDNQIQFDYYYGLEAEQFSFYRIPRLLIKDERFKGLSNDAKLLYGLMLDRMSLSMKNEWLDEENRAYIIYTIDNIMEDLSCGKNKAVNVLAELDSIKGIGLVEKKRRGFGQPDIIYVKNFIAVTRKVIEEEPVKADTYTEVGKSNFKKFENQTTRSTEIKLQEVGKANPNYTYHNQTNQSYTDRNYIVPQSTEESDDDDDIKLKEQLGYDAVLKKYPAEIAEAVYAEIKNRDNDLLLSLPASVFENICYNIAHYASTVYNKQAYIQKCIDNLLAAKNLSKATEREKEKMMVRNRSSPGMKQNYNIKELERQLLDN